ncbi:hypothetical protein [Alicyclobacillus sp. SP_1]|uniref:hypothetical protein n=1 Tax=Alicyclobacillus sp. SP_1 TaxID=2942475 RepID=UPI0021572680|nr:hypothetical protein [Alicyclobacillus sp. SP_1]
MKKLVSGIMLATLLLTGCGQTPKDAPSGGHEVSNSVFFGSTTESIQYLITEQKVPKVGRELFDFQGSDTTSQGPSGWGTNDNDATKLYEIPGVDTSKSVAVQLKDGSYVRANAEKVTSNKS